MPKIVIELPEERPRRSRLIGPLELMIAAIGVSISLLQFMEHKKQTQKYRPEICMVVEEKTDRNVLECLKRKRE